MLLNILQIAASAALSLATYFLYSGYCHRSKFRALQKQGTPMPKWNWITGHLLAFKSKLNQLPADVFANIAIQEILEELGTEMVYLDLWPIYPATLFVSSPEACNEVAVILNPPKPKEYGKMFEPIVGGPSLVTMNDQQWKYWRTLFNPGFSGRCLFDQIPAIVDSAEALAESLKRQAGKSYFFLDELTTRLTIDVIGKVSLSTDFSHQTREHPLALAMRKLISWTSFWNPISKLNPARFLFQRYYSYVVNKHIRKHLDQCVDEFRKRNKSTTNGHGPVKSITTLALEAHLSDNKKRDDATSSRMDAKFVRYVLWQVRLFLFTGHDTTASALNYTYHMLFKNREILARVREEHNRVFGPDPVQASVLLRQNPALVNNVPFTLAVIKETLRMFPPAGTMRLNIPGATLTDCNGRRFPIDDVHVSLVPQATHANSRVWPSAAEFIPERFLVDHVHPLHPYPGAYRPFEQGPRGCIGQALVFLEMRIALILTLRTMYIQPAYEAVDAERLAGRSWLRKTLLWMGLVQEEIKTVKGERAYLCENGSARPADSYPCSVTLLQAESPAS